MSARPESRKILRFGLTERVYHWAQALPYLVLLGSGGLLLIQRQAQHEFIAAPALILVHKVAGLMLPVLLLLVFLLGDRRTLLGNLWDALSWPGRALIGLAGSAISCLIPFRGEPPTKFNAGQKFHMLLLMVLIATFFCSGLYIWLAPGALLSWYVHVAAFLVAAPLLGGHLFLALVHPVKRKGLSGMFTGRVDANWARDESGEPPEAGPRRPGRPS